MRRSRASLSLTRGDLAIADLEVTDSARPTHNSFQAERITARVSVPDLLAKRLVVDLIECRAMGMDTPRKRPGEVYRPGEKSPSDDLDLGGLLGKLPNKAAEYQEQIKRFNKLLRKLHDWLESQDPAARADKKPDKADLIAEAKAIGYLKLSAKDYLVKRPTWVIREATVSRILVTPDLPTFTLTGRDISSHPSLHPRKMTLRAEPDEAALNDFLKKAVGGQVGDIVGDLLGGKKDGPDEADKKTGGGLLDGLLKDK